MTACSLNKKFSLTDSNLEHELFLSRVHNLHCKMSCSVYVSFDYVYSISNENWEHCGLGWFFLIFIWCENRVQKKKKLSKQEKKLLWFTCIAKKCISSAPSTRDLKKKPYVPNFGYFSNCTSWSNYQYYFCLQTSDDKNMDSLEVNQWLKAACIANLFQLLKQIKETNERCCCHF